MEDFFRLNKIPMIPGGFWPLPNTRYLELLKQLRGYTSIFLCNILAITEFWEGIDQSQNIVLLIEVIVTATTCYITSLKIVTFMKDRTFTREILETINDLMENTPVPNDDETIVKSTEFWKNRAYSITKAIMSIYFSPYVFYMTVPWLKYYLYDVKEFQFPSKVPFDTSAMKNYVIVYIFEFITSQMVIWTFASTEAFFATVVMFVCSRVEVLKYSLETATKEATEKWKATPLFGKSIEYHKTLLRLCNMLEELYSASLLIQFFFSMLTICMLCFLTTQNNVEKGKQLTFLSFIITMLLQLFIYCYFGQLLENKFETLCDDAFHSSWYDAPLPYQKDVQFLIMRCRQSVTLTAYKIMPVNLESFFSIVKTSMSYFTLLQSMAEEEE